MITTHAAPRSARTCLENGHTVYAEAVQRWYVTCRATASREDGEPVLRVQASESTYSEPAPIEVVALSCSTCGATDMQPPDWDLSLT
jgi:hypothetical protein